MRVCLRGGSVLSAFARPAGSSHTRWRAGRLISIFYFVQFHCAFAFCVSFVTTSFSARGRPQVDIQFTDEAIREIAKVGAYVNKTVENIGARRLHTVLERIVEVSQNIPPTVRNGSYCSGLEPWGGACNERIAVPLWVVRQAPFGL